jgi:hypothetical protein
VDHTGFLTSFTVTFTEEFPQAGSTLFERVASIDTMPPLGSGTYTLAQLGACISTCPASDPSPFDGCWPATSPCATGNCPWDAQAPAQTTCTPIDGTLSVTTSTTNCRSDNTNIEGQPPGKVCDQSVVATLTMTSTQGAGVDLAGTTLTLRYSESPQPYDCSSFND